MEAIKMGHYSVMMMTLKAMKVRTWSQRNLRLYGAVIPRFIVTMDDATQFMLNIHQEAFYMRLMNEDVEPVRIDPNRQIIHTRRIKTPDEARAALKDWYGSA
jgi:hypothetical protein